MRSALLSVALFLVVGLVGCRGNHTMPRLAVHTLRPGDDTLQLASASGFDSVVQVFPWREVEPTQNQFHWEATDRFVAGAEYHGLALIVRLDQHPAWASPVDLSLNAPPEKLEDYEDYVRRVVERYRGRLAGIILWNEPNLAIEWGGDPPDPTAFTELLCAGYQAAKGVDPNLVVAAAALAPTNNHDLAATDDRLFLRQLYRAGAGDCFDVLAAHPYSFGLPPEAPQRDRQHPAFGRLADLRQIMLDHGDSDKPVWITEMGWTVDPPADQADIGVTPVAQADYLRRALEIVRRDWPWVELVTVWNLSVPRPGDPFGGYSLVEENGQPRPALEAWRAVAGSRTERGLTPPVPERADQIQILGQDVQIHLGDTDLQPPWWPLFGGRKPSLSWTGGFYVVEPGELDWILLLELMQQNEIGATVEINDTPLSPDLPQQDFTRRWLTVQRRVPASLLHRGYNELRVTTVRLLPDAQQPEFTWDDFQVKNIRLVRPQASGR